MDRNKVSFKCFTMRFIKEIGKINVKMRFAHSTFTNKMSIHFIWIILSRVFVIMLKKWLEDFNRSLLNISDFIKYIQDREPEGFEKFVRLKGAHVDVAS